MKAEIVETKEGRITLSKLKVPINDGTHVIEIHRRTADRYDVAFMVLTADELQDLHDALATMRAK